MTTSMSRIRVETVDYYRPTLYELSYKLYSITRPLLSFERSQVIGVVPGFPKILCLSSFIAYLSAVDKKDTFAGLKLRAR